MKFRILGPVEVWSDGQPLALGGSRQLALLAFLLLQANRPASTDALIDGVWDGAQREGGLKRLSVAVARLRRALEPVLVDGVELRTVNGGYMLVLPPGEVDCERFETLLAEGREALSAGEPTRASERLRAALDCWYGTALADLSFETFAQAEIGRLEELRMVALEARIDAELQLGHDAALVGELTALLRAHPSREHLAEQLMLALYRSGRQAEALDVYRRTHAYLTSELGLDPGPALRRMQARILEQSEAIEPTIGRDTGPSEADPIPVEMVTMVIAEIDGSADLVQRLGHLHRELVAAVDELLHRLWGHRTGVRVARHRAGILGIFPSPEGALEAALAAREVTGTIDWPGGVELRLRIGVHTGYLRVSASGYWGEDVHYTARLAEVAHGGQVLISAATAGLAPSADLADLGEHRLNDSSVPAHVFGLGSGPHRVPRTADPLRSNLPRAHGELIGREVELAELVTALRTGESRLVTITGPGGSGKTRLALAVAESVVDALPDGAFLIPLAGLSGSDGVPAAIAAPLGIQLPRENETAAAIGRALADRVGLLVLDNFEHLLDAAAAVTELLDAAPSMRVLVTSQAPLRVRGERLLALGALGLPPGEDRASVEAAPACRLLIQRAHDRDAGFELTADNAPSLARLCNALGGLPLALELAAARLTLLSPDELLSRLDKSPDAVGRGPRDLPARQRGLRAALDWTHALLDEDQARLMRRLAVFAGPVSLERIEQICGAGSDLLEALAQLVELSLVTRTGDGYFVMHASVREYGRAKLERAGERQLLERRHAETYAAMGSMWGRRFLFDVVAVQSAVLREEADVGQALIWAGSHDPERFAQVIGGLSMPLLFAARLTSWSEAVEQALAQDAVAGRPRAWLLLAASLVAFQHGEVELARARLASTVLAAEQTADLRLAALMGTCSILFRVLAGTSAGVRADYHLLSRRVSELRDRELVQLVSGLDAYVLAYCEQRYGEAEAIWKRLAADRSRTDFAASSAQFCWPDCALLEADYAVALDGYRAALRGARERARAPTVAYQLEGIAMSLSGLGRHEEALEAAGWAASVRQTAGPATNTWYRQKVRDAKRRSRAAIGLPGADAAYARGRMLSLDAAVNAGLEVRGVAAGSWTLS